MKYTIVTVLALASLACANLAFAKNPVFYQDGTLTNMNSVQCGTDENGARTITGELLGTDAAHKKDRTVLCQEYTLESKSVVYVIRPRDDKHPALLPVGEKAQFRIKKDKLVLKVAELDGKEREYQVVSMTPRNAQVTAENRAKLPQ